MVVLPGHPSDTTSLCFVILVAFVAAGFLWASGSGSQAAGESDSSAKRRRLKCTAAVAVWLAGTDMLASSGALQGFDKMPPPFFPFMLVAATLTTLVAFSPLGTRLARNLPLAVLIGFQAFRLPLEILLHRLYQEGVLPVQMTYQGYNFDIFTGLFALPLTAWLLNGKPPRSAIVAFNVVGSVLLATVVFIAIFSTPTPLRLFFGEPAVTFVTFSPFVWLPSVLVQAALLGHILLFRRLSATPEETAAG